MNASLKICSGDFSSFIYDVRSVCQIPEVLIKLGEYKNYERIEDLLEKNPVAKYLAYESADANPDFIDFDNEFYRTTYPDCLASDKAPILHWIEHKNDRLKNATEMEYVAAELQKCEEFDAAMYFNKYMNGSNEKMSVFSHYACYGRVLYTDPNEFFSTKYYLDKYLDIRERPINPFLHFSNHGKTEGRLAAAPHRNKKISGHRKVVWGNPTLIIFCHEASRTGAPILGASLTAELAATFNVVVVLLKGGDLEFDFKKNCVELYYVEPDYADVCGFIDDLKKSFGRLYALINSVACSAVAPALEFSGVPTLTLIHEYADYMRRPVVEAISFSDKVIFPARSVAESGLGAAREMIGCNFRNYDVRHQGKCRIIANEGVKLSHNLTRSARLEGIRKFVENGGSVFLGCGWVQMRKGVDLFLQAALEYRRNFPSHEVKFVWVGGGFDSDNDYAYGIWLGAQIRLCEVGDFFEIHDETDELDEYFALASCFLLSSRLDPFPNVAIDAVFAGVPVVSFDRATGFSEFIARNPEVGHVVGFLDCSEMAKTASLFYQRRARSFGKITKEFSFKSYSEYICSQIILTGCISDFAIDYADKLSRENKFDYRFYASGVGDLRPEMKLSSDYMRIRYVKNLIRGRADARSLPGANDDLRLLNIDADFNPKFEESLGFSRGVLSLPDWRMTEIIEGLPSVAVHIHAHYLDGLIGLVNKFAPFFSNIDFFITTTSSDRVREIEGLIKENNWAIKCAIKLVENRGRDVLPFLSVAEEMRSYEIIGHFHLKRSPHNNSINVDLWMRLIENSLVGDFGSSFAFVMERFLGDSGLGLVYPEDPCIVGWGKNKALAEELLNFLGIYCELEDSINFPIGNMFWARNSAVFPMFSLCQNQDFFPAEPLKPDGSYLHAMERLWPIVVKSRGFHCSTVLTRRSRRYS